MKDNNEQNRTVLTIKQQRAISEVLQAKSISEGVKKARISRTQFYEWLTDPAFKGEFHKQRDKLIEAAMDELKAATGDAVKALKELLTSGNENVRLRAAESVLGHILKFKELEEIDYRLKNIEEQLER